MIKVVVYNDVINKLIPLYITNSKDSFQEVLNGYFGLVTDIELPNIRMFYNDEYQFLYSQDTSYMLVQLDDGENVRIRGSILFAKVEDFRYVDITDEDQILIEQYIKEHRQ